ncbi:hypothetical protein RAH32_12175 [Paracoccus sp. WLY502]|nr:hypothetical protein [Paracoccus sp. WLY502]
MAPILADMLLAHSPRRDLPLQGDRDAKERLGHEDALGVVAQRPLPEVGRDRLAGVEPGVNGRKSSTLPPYLRGEDSA